MDKIGFLVGVQKGRFGPRKPNIVIDFPSCSARNWVVFCCFGCVLKKVSGCWFLALLEVAAAIKISDQSNLTKIRFLLDKIGFLVGFQKGRFGPRKPIIVIDFALCSARKLGGVLLFRLCFTKGVWLLVSCFIIGSSSSQN